jgi:hypothetical protein
MDREEEMKQLIAENLRTDQRKLEQKLSVMHKGPCSSPRRAPGDTACTCPRDCPLHGRCCDCIAHHKQERLEARDAGTARAGDFKWMPHCLAWFDERNGVACAADAAAGSRVPTAEDFARMTYRERHPDAQEDV